MTAVLTFVRVLMVFKRWVLVFVVGLLLTALEEK